ncbi:conserved hypothetical protein [Histoplasma capsulatum var. duboisii H88]|uniref:Uncharacterized protein n=1 Tax=Ajellomyces capsulatus (strain H88) TaxID=544711 RepID=F0UFD2_AJEC8|nr:conserved hypothetical protein [Histoplasma capsulatum var. duboisii H88]
MNSRFNCRYEMKLTESDSDVPHNRCRDSENDTDNKILSENKNNNYSSDARYLITCMKNHWQQKKEVESFTHSDAVDVEDKFHSFIRCQLSRLIIVKESLMTGQEA